MYIDTYTPQKAVSKYCCVFNEFCKGTMCMAWRWELVPIDPPIGTNFTAVPKFAKGVKGYCGLAP